MSLMIFSDPSASKRSLTRRLSERLKFPVMSIHEEENGLVDVANLT